MGKSKTQKMDEENVRVGGFVVSVLLRMEDRELRDMLKEFLKEKGYYVYPEGDDALAVHIGVSAVLEGEDGDSVGYPYSELEEPIEMLEGAENALYLLKADLDSFFTAYRILSNSRRKEVKA